MKTIQPNHHYKIGTHMLINGKECECAKCATFGCHTKDAKLCELFTRDNCMSCARFCCMTKAGQRICFVEVKRGKQH